jgi:hypothetical protein
MRILTLFSIIFYNTLCCGQENYLPNRRKISLSLTTIGGRSIYSTNIYKSQTKYPTPEHRVGFILNRSLNKQFELQLRQVLGVKRRGKVQNVLTPFNYLEESTKIDYLFSEISFLTNYNLYKSFNIKSGLNSRFFFPSSNFQYGFLGSKFDFGLIFGFSVKLSSRIYIGSEYMFGLTKVLKLNYYDSNLQPQNGLLEIRNRIGQITLEYCFKSRKVIK